MKKILVTVLSAAMILSNASVFAIQSIEKDYLLQEDFSDFKNGSNWDDNNRVDSWRIEGWNADLSEDVLSVVDSVPGSDKKNVLKLANTKDVIRGGRSWSLDSAEFIKPGESFSMEFDIYAEDNSRISMGITGKDDYRCEETGGMGGLFIIKNNNDGNKVYFAGAQELAFHNAIELKGITTFRRNEFNHVKIDYALNEDVSLDTLDTMTMTVTNSAGETSSQTINYVKFRNSKVTADPITKVRGINFIKYEAGTTMYLDNIEFYKTIDSSEPELLGEDYVEFTDDEGTKYTDLEEVPAYANKLTLKFDSTIKTVESGAVTVVYGNNKSAGINVIPVGQNIDVEFESGLVPGFEYTVYVDSSKVIGASGNKMKEDAVFSFKTKQEDMGDVVDGYVREYYFTEDFSNFVNGVNDASNDRLSAWRVENAGLTGWNQDIAPQWLCITDIDTMEGALKMGGKGYMGGVRGGHRFNGEIGPGESYVVELDILADENAVFSIGPHMTSETTQLSEETATKAYYFHLKQSEKGNVEKLYYNSDQSTSNNPSQVVPGVIFKRNEVNHIKIEYTFNDDMSYGTLDTMKITVNNSEGETSGTVNPNYRYKSNQVPPLTGAKGITFKKWGDKEDQNTESEVYIDNIEVYSQYEAIDPLIKNITVSHNDGKEEKEPTSTDANVNNISIGFNTAMKYVAEYVDLVDSEGNRVNYNTSYAKGGTVMNIELPDMLKADEEYTLTISEGALSKAGFAMVSGYTYTFKTNESREIIIDNFATTEEVNETDNTVKITAKTDLVKTFEEKQMYSLYIMAYDSEGKLLDIGYKAITLNDMGKESFTKELTIENQDKIAVVKTALCTFPGFKITKLETIKREAE